MTTTVMDEYILPTLVRYIDQYRWHWPRAVKIINLYYGTEYTVREMKRIYKMGRSVGSREAMQ